MERTGWNVKHLTEDVICDINKRMIERYGGKPYSLADRNQANRSSLVYILEATSELPEVLHNKVQ